MGEKEEMRVLVACEESQEVCKAFRALGHEAYSCDILPCSGGHPEWHIQDDVLKHLNNRWDMMIAHPPCTDLAVSGAAWFKEKIADGRQNKALEFVRKLMEAQIEKIAIENPVSVISTKIRKPDCIIEPFQFGHPETKKTCLWLKNLPLLIHTNIVEPKYIIGKDGKKYSPTHYNWMKENRSMLRSRTYPGIAKAMAEQWGKLIV